MHVYVLEEYIKPDATFPPELWAEFEATTERTTNSCESFHAKLNGLFYTAHPNIFQLIDILKRIQIDTYIQMRSPATKRRAYQLKKEKFIRDKMTEFVSKSINRLQYIKALSYKFLPAT